MRKLFILLFFCLWAGPIFAQSVLISEIMVDADFRDGQFNNTGEWTELYNPTNAPIDIGCWVLADGDWWIRIPSGTTLNPGAYYLIGSDASADPTNGGAIVDLNINTCPNCTDGVSGFIGVYTNGGEQVGLFDDTGNLVDALIWGGGQAIPTTVNVPAGGGCAAQTLNLPGPASPEYEVLPPDFSNGFTHARVTDTCDVWDDNRVAQPTNFTTPGAPNISIYEPISLVMNPTTSVCPGELVTYNGTPETFLGLPLEWTLVPGGTGSAISGPSVGNSVDVQIGNNPGTDTLFVSEVCAIVDTVVITVSPSFTLTVDVTNESCPGAGDGQILVTPNGGTSPYDFQLDGGAIQTDPTSFTFTGLSAANSPFDITVTDASGCSATDNGVVLNADPSSVTATITTTDESCTGAGDGEIQVSSPSGGTGPYTVALDGGTPQALGGTPVDFTGLSATNSPFTIEVSDANGCTFTDNAVNVVAAPSSVTATITTTAESCTGAGDGEIQVSSPSGGTGPYTVALDGGTPQALGGTPVDFTGLSSTNSPFTIEVSDANGCTFTDNAVNIPAAPSSVSATITTTDESCTGANDGVISVSNPSGGTAPYQVSLDGGTPQALGGTPVDFTGLTGLNSPFTIEVEDANGCTFTDNNVTINALPSTVTATISVVDESCPGAADGVITVSNPSGGTAPYDVTLDGGAPQSFGGNPVDFTGLTNLGSPYTVEVTDDNGCAFSSVQNVQLSGSGVDLMVDYTLDENCFDALDGEVQLSASGGAGNYTFFIDGPGGPQNNTTGLFTGLDDGTYEVIANDGTCADTSTLTLNADPDLFWNPASTQLTPENDCLGELGEITVGPSNASGTPPFTDFEVTAAPPGVTLPLTSSTGTFDDVPTGTYTVQMTDAAGCTVDTTVDIGLVEEIELTVDNTVPSTCAQTPDGQITVSATDGHPGANYSFGISPAAGFQQNPGEFTQLPADDYTITVTDGQGCTTTLTSPVTISGPDSIFWLPDSIQLTDPLCNGESSGAIQVYATGGTGTGFTYSITPDLGNQTGTTFGNIPSGTYTLTADDNGCSIDTTFTLFDPPTIVFSVIDSQDVTCFGGSDGSAEISTPTGGAAPLTIEWDTAPLQDTEQATGLSAGTYTVAVSDGICTLTDSVVIDQPDSLEASLLSTTDESCEGAENGSIELSAQNGTGPYEYSIDGGQTYQPSPSFADLAPGTYQLQVRDDCGAVVDLGQATLAPGDPLQVSFQVSEPEVVLPDGFTFTNTSASDATSYTWDFGDDGPSRQGEVVSYEYQEEGEYTVTLTISDGVCEASAEETVTVIAPNLLIPNVFTPNGDGVNDFFTFNTGAFRDLELRMYDRWGNLLYSDKQFRWNGQTDDGEEVAEGVYVYRLEGTLRNGREVERTGTVTLMR